MTVKNSSFPVKTKVSFRVFDRGPKLVSDSFNPDRVQKSQSTLTSEELTVFVVGRDGVSQ